MLKPSEFTKIISKHNSEGVFSLAGFLLCTSKLSLDEESAEYIFNSTGIKQNHAYAILNSVVFENHRLVQIGNTHACDKWKELHKEWNSLHYFYNKFSSKLPRRPYISHLDDMSFWMDIDQYCEHFSSLTVCEYRKDWKEIRFRQTNDLKQSRETEYAWSLH